MTGRWGTGITTRKQIPAAERRTALRKDAGEALASGRLVAAEAALTALLSIDSTSAYAHRHLSNIYFRTGDYDRALAHALVWETLEPANPSPLLQQVRICKVLARHRNAQELGERLLRMSGSHAALAEAASVFSGSRPELLDQALSALERLLAAACRSGNFDQAVKILRTLSRFGDEGRIARAFACLGERPRFAAIEAEHLLRTGRYEAALQLLRQLQVKCNEGGASDAAYAAASIDQSIAFAEDRVQSPDGAAPTVIGDMNVPEHLTEALRRANVDEFIVFHTDHFEPWTPVFDPAQLPRLEQFAEQMARRDYTRALTLIYCPGTPFATQPIEPMAPGLTYLGITAPGRPEAQQRRIAEAMKTLPPSFEFHLHIHHEDLIPCAESRSVLAETVGQQIPRDRHNELLELHVRANLVQLQRDTGIVLRNWASVHGKWALNGSDRNVCTIDDEIGRLQALGCWGDFTFPAGRRHTTPRSTEPFSIKPRIQSKAYDRLDADIRLLGEQPRRELWDEGRFFIWSTALSYPAVSLDYSSYESSIVNYDVAATLSTWIERGVRDGRAILVKTHAHSMAEGNKIGDKLVFPHLFPRNQRLFTLLEKVCDTAGVRVQYATVNQIKTRLMG